MKRLIYLLPLTLIITVFSHSGYTEPVVTDGLVSYWTFDPVSYTHLTLPTILLV